MNLIFCTSPLQVLIAKEIVKETNEKFIGVYLKMSNDKRQKLYYDKLSTFCEDTFFIESVDFINSYFSWVSKFNLNNIYVASLDNFIPYIVFDKNTMNLYTYDDGSTSFITPNFYTNNLNFNIYRGLTLKDVFELSQNHYTIFDDCKLFPKEKQVKLNLDVKPDDFNRSNNNKRVKVFLGQFLGNINLEEDYDYTKKLTIRALEKTGKDVLYYPHPRVNLEIGNKVSTDLCFEEEIYELLRKYEFVDVYGFHSTSFSLIKNIEGVSVKPYKTFLSINETEQLGIPYENLSLSDTYLSVIMPTYNNESTIEESINSVLNQIHENFELIIVNDGSFDNTENILEKYSNNPKVKILNCLHRGISLSLIEGIKNSKYDFIARQDADDIWSPIHLELLLNEFDKNPQLDIVSSKVTTDINKLKSTVKWNRNYDLKGEDLWLDLAYDNKFNHSTVIFKKAAYNKSGGYNSKYDGFEDWELWSRMVTKNNALIINHLTTFYRLSNKEDIELRFRHKLAKSRNLSLNEVMNEF